MVTAVGDWEGASSWSIFAHELIEQIYLQLKYKKAGSPMKNKSWKEQVNAAHQRGKDIEQKIHNVKFVDDRVPTEKVMGIFYLPIKFTDRTGRTRTITIKVSANEVVDVSSK